MATNVNFVSNKEIEAEEKEKIKQRQGVDALPSQTFISALAADLDRKWEKAKRAKNLVEQRMLDNKRARKGEYDPKKLAQIQSMFGPDYIPVYMRITDTKCRAAMAWIKDVYQRPDDKPWSIEPTPEPELPEDVKKAIEMSTFQSVLNQRLALAQTTGRPFSKEELVQDMQGLLPIVMEQVDRMIKKKSKEAAEKMKKRIDDQFTEGRWYQAMDDLIYDIVTYKAAFLKGPSLRKERVRKREFDPYQGKHVTKIVDRVVYKYERRSPFNIYPSPDSTTMDDGFVFDLTYLTRKHLSQLIGVKGFNDEAIREVLQEHRTGGLREWIGIDTTKARLEDRDTMAIWDTEKIATLEYYGSAQGSVLVEWGMDPRLVPDLDKEYEIIAWKIGRHIIKAIMNPDPMGTKPLYKASFSEDPDAFWGDGLPELISDIQDICNAIARAIVNNVGIASGPQVEINTDKMALGQSEALWPWKVWKSTNAQMDGAKAVNFYAPPLVVDKLMRTFEFFIQRADEDSGVPRYVHGETETGGAGKTASGLSMLMTQSAKGIKMVIANMDNGITEPSVEKQYYFNLDFEDDAEIMGDLKVVAKGSTSLIAKEQQAIRKTEFMDRTNNPVDMSIIRAKGRAKLLEDAMKALEIDSDEVLEEAQFELSGSSGMFAQPMVGAGDQGQIGPDGQPINAAGDRRAGADFAAFNRPEAE